MNQDFIVDKKRSTAFYLLLVTMALLSSTLLFRAYYLYNSNSEVPCWFVNSSIVFGSLAWLSLIFIYYFKKIGIYLLVTSLFLDIVLQPGFNLINSVLTVFTLFVFVGYGLVVLIPRWKMFS